MRALVTFNLLVTIDSGDPSADETAIEDLRRQVDKGVWTGMVDAVRPLMEEHELTQEEFDSVCLYLGATATLIPEQEIHDP